MLERISKLRDEADKAIAEAASADAVAQLRVHYLGRRSELTEILRGIGELPADRSGCGGVGRKPGARGDRGGPARRAAQRSRAPSSNSVWRPTRST